MGKILKVDAKTYRTVALQGARQSDRAVARLQRVSKDKAPL